MSFRKERLFQGVHSDVILASYLPENISDEDFYDLILEILHTGVHGFCFSLYEEGQRPGDIVTREQIQRRLSILSKYSKWTRSFSCTEGNEWIPEIAKSMGMQTLVGAWLGSDKEKNEEEIEGLIKLAKEGYVDIAAVGNEVLYRGDLNDQELLDYIHRVKSEVPNIRVGYVDAYYEFVQKPHITQACDVLLCNLYPFWEGTPFESSLAHMKSMYQQVVAVSEGKQVIVTETGWPSQGEAVGGAVPNFMNALKYFVFTQLWTINEGIESFYFSSFDEDWKVGNEGTVGAYWGVWDKKEELKFKR